MFYVASVRRGLELVARFPYKVGVVSFMAYPSLLKSDEKASLYIKELLEDPFFDLIEVPRIGDKEWSLIDASRKGLGREVDFALGLQPEILVRGVNPSPLDREERRRAERILVDMTREACERGIKTIALCSGPAVGEEKLSLALESMKDTLIAVGEEASRCGAIVLLETFDTDKDKKRLIGKLQLAASLVEDARGSAPNLYILWDLSHAPLLEEEPQELKSYPDLIGHIHIGAAKEVDGRLYDWHPGFYRPGAVNSEREIVSLLRVLEEIGYKGAISFEVKPEDGQLTGEVLHSSKSTLIRAFQLYLEGA